MTLFIAFFRFLTTLLGLLNNRRETVRMEDRMPNRQSRWDHTLLLKALKARREARKKHALRNADSNPRVKNLLNTSYPAADDINGE
jgi:hypothetical protein